MEQYPTATEHDIRWDLLRLGYSNRRAVTKVHQGGEWNGEVVLRNLPGESRRMYLRCRHVPDEGTANDDADDEDEHEHEADHIHSIEPAIPLFQTPFVQKALFQVKIHGMLDSAVWTILPNALRTAIQARPSFGDIAQSLLRCSAELMKVIEITVVRRNGPSDLGISSRWATYSGLWILMGSKSMVEWMWTKLRQGWRKCIENIDPFGLHGGLVWVGGDL